MLSNAQIKCPSVVLMKLSVQENSISISYLELFLAESMMVDDPIDPGLFPLVLAAVPLLAER